MFRARKLDMEMPPDTVETVGVNELFVAVGVDVSLTTEEAASGSLGTHRAISSNSNTESISSILSVNSGAVSLIVLKRPRTGWWVSSQPFEFLTKATRVSGPWFAPTPSLPCSSCPSSVENFVFLRRIRDQYRVNRRCLLHPHFRAHVQLNVCSLGDRVQHSSFCGFCMLVIC